ncbi:DUF427 domain-containing protein [Tenggerimyces flavus]|uniref:DUF427 domain-containing protein n=1 Tax=Tenggerimyces flavus TaxID=1708749 RepID=A0ABV7YLM1_9ACTN|nr:DUF427 domain-containing protein [Tenggerimyces flavus]MBM7789397.1 uncharacterized protein (DUF427 family) [Tenggerimyces flavus]
MSITMRELLFGAVDEVRREPTEWRLRVRFGDTEIVDTTKAVLVWEPRRVVPSYAVPLTDLRVPLATSQEAPPADPGGLLHPGISFAVHSAKGESFDVVVGETTLPAAAFRLEDSQLDQHAVLDFDAFDAWYEEDELLVSHAREPYHWVRTLPSSRHVRIEHHGILIAESTRPTFVYETSLPVRYYLPREDVVADLTPSSTRTACAYKGHASYFSAPGLTDIAWSYPEPRKQVADLAGLVAFYDDLLDVYVDGVLREKSNSVLAKLLLDEFAVHTAPA